LETYFEQHPPASVNEASAKIEELTGIRRGPNLGSAKVGVFVEIVVSGFCEICFTV